MATAWSACHHLATRGNSGGAKEHFLIARKGHEGDENQLTEMLAYLLQEAPELISGWVDSLGVDVVGAGVWESETQRAVPGGFLDLVLFSPGRALVIVESKLGSTTSYEQIKKYLDYAKGVPVTGARALVFTTKNPEPWPTGVEEEAGAVVKLIRRRWQELGEYLRETEVPLAHDLVAMLEREGLVTPDALTTEDWATWREGNRIGRQLRTLLEEATEDLKAVAPGFRKLGSVNFANTGAIYRPFEFDGLSLYVGFWPSRKPLRAEDHALVTVYVLNTALPLQTRRAAGLAAVERAAIPNLKMSGWSEQHVLRTVPTHEVLTAVHFTAQRDQLVEHVREALDYFRSLGYLEPAVQAALA